MTELWADYSGGRPGGAALKAAGYTGVIRYVGVGSAGKRLTVAEAQDLLAHGIQVRCVVELGTTDTDGGYSAGVANAHAALADPAVQALPADTIIYAANDKPAWSQADVAYVQGFRDVLGLARTGVYGFGQLLAAVHAAGFAASYWQAGDPPSRTGTDSFVNLWQRQGTPGSPQDGPAAPTQSTVGGVVVDNNNRINQEVTVEWSDPFPTPVLDATGSYTGDQKDANGQPVTASAEDMIRFGNAATWFVVAQVNAISAALAELAAQVTALKGAQAPSQLTGSAEVTVQLAPPAAAPTP